MSVNVCIKNCITIGEQFPKLMIYYLYVYIHTQIHVNIDLKKDRERKYICVSYMCTNYRVEKQVIL